jgi:hypothetical protein
VIKKKAEEILKQKDLNNINSLHVECDSKCDTVDSRGDWKRLKITQIIPEQHNRKAQN